MLFTSTIHSIKEIKIKRKDILEFKSFIDTLSANGIKTSISYRYVIIPISSLKNLNQIDLDWIIAITYSRCKGFSLNIEND